MLIVIISANRHLQTFELLFQSRVHLLQMPQLILCYSLLPVTQIEVVRSPHALIHVLVHFIPVIHRLVNVAFVH